MLFGSIAYDGGHLFLDDDERQLLIDNHPEVLNYIRPAVGAAEMLRGLKRWCIWVEDDEYRNAAKIPPLLKKFKQVSDFRRSSQTKSTQDFAGRPYRFKQNTYKKGAENIIIIPRVSSERREYIPLDIFSGETITVDAQVIYDASLFLFGLLSSRIHVAWVKLTSGRMKSDIRYSSAVSYNNFPIPEYTEEKYQSIERAALCVLEARELYPNLTLSKLYDPLKMPIELREAHENLDKLVESLYETKPMLNEQQLLKTLFSTYNKMTGGQNA